MPILAISVSFLIAIVGCTQPFYESYVNVNPSGWHKDSIAHFEFEVNDSLQAYNIALNVRNQGSYLYSNLWLFVNVIAPNSSVLTDTFAVVLARQNGAWLGKGTSGVYDLQIPFRNNVVFPMNGTYTVNIEQAMRDVKLQGIQNIGIRIDQKEQ